MAKLLRISDDDHHRILALAANSGLRPEDVVTALLDQHSPPEGEPLPAVSRQTRELRRLRRILNTPVYQPFLEAVRAEAAHQAARANEYEDETKSADDWFWLLDHLQGKAMASHQNGNFDHALHHTISSAAVLFHWHAAITAQQAQAPPPETDQATTDED